LKPHDTLLEETEVTAVAEAAKAAEAAEEPKASGGPSAGPFGAFCGAFGPRYVLREPEAQVVPHGEDVAR
jgi:hypothetical protein